MGLSCLEHLLGRRDELNFEVTAVLTNVRGKEIQDLAICSGIRILKSLDHYLELTDIDLLISVQYNEILKKEHIEKARQISVNLHMAPLPEYRGCNQFSFAIINEEKFFGTTMHIMNVGIDSGDIICERRFEVPDQIWVKQLHELTETHSFEMFKEFLPNLVSGNYVRVTQKELLKSRKINFYKRSDINSIKKLELEWSQEKLIRYIRALSMPGFVGPFIVINNQKIYLNVEN